VANIGRVLFCCGKSLVEKLFGIFVDSFSLGDKRKDHLTVNVSGKIFIENIFPLIEFECAQLLEQISHFCSGNA
jgi:hypothetical protein